MTLSLFVRLLASQYDKFRSFCLVWGTLTAYYVVFCLYFYLCHGLPTVLCNIYVYMNYLIISPHAVFYQFLLQSAYETLYKNGESWDISLDISMESERFWHIFLIHKVIHSVFMNREMQVEIVWNDHSSRSFYINGWYLAEVSLSKSTNFSNNFPNIIVSHLGSYTDNTIIYTSLNNLSCLMESNLQLI